MSAWRVRGCPAEGHASRQRQAELLCNMSRGVHSRGSSASPLSKCWIALSCDTQVMGRGELQQLSGPRVISVSGPGEKRPLEPVIWLGYGFFCTLIHRKTGVERGQNKLRLEKSSKQPLQTKTSSLTGNLSNSAM